MDTLTAIKERRSIRDFSAKPIDLESVKSIVDCGRFAPTGRNEQPWEFVVFTDQEMRRKIAAMTDFGRFIEVAPVCVGVFCRDTKYYLEDGSAATQNILLAATVHGLGSCWVAGDKKPYANRIRELLGVPEGYKLVSLIALGYPTERELPPRTKRPLEQILHWERW